MTSFTSPLAKQIERFLEYKRGLGFAYQNEEGILRELDRVADKADLSEAILDETLVRQFVAGSTRSMRACRLSVVRQLARYLAVEEPRRTFVPPRRFLGVKRQQPVVRVLSRDEAGRFLRACDEMIDSLRYPHRGIIHGTQLRTMLQTGLRRGEARDLKVSDVDLDAGILVVRRGKFGKSRFVPVTDDLAERLRDYDSAIWELVAGRCVEDAFFPGTDGHSACSRMSFYYSFRETLERAGITHGGRGNGPSPHTLRHTFAVLRLLAWYEQGADLSVKLPLLATYLGHVGLESTQIYLHMTLDLVGEVSRRHQARFGDIITTEVTI